jgi:hypothetical protein
MENVTTTAKTASIVLFVTLEWRKASDLCPVIRRTKRKRACLNGHPANKTQPDDLLKQALRKTREIRCQILDNNGFTANGLQSEIWHLTSDVFLTEDYGRRPGRFSKKILLHKGTAVGKSKHTMRKLKRR